MENKINKIKKYLNNKIGELYLEEVKSVFDDIKEYNLEYEGRWYYVEDINYKFIKEEWNGEEEVMLCRYGDRGGIDIGFEYRDDYEEEEEWIDLRESDCEMSVLYIYEKEGSKVYRRYFDEKEEEVKEELIEI
jgi:hypothetical protein